MMHLQEEEARAKEKVCTSPMMKKTECAPKMITHSNTSNQKDLPSCSTQKRSRAAAAAAAP
jgi:hypothetical protein